MDIGTSLFSYIRHYFYLLLWTCEHFFHLFFREVGSLYKPYLWCVLTFILCSAFTFFLFWNSKWMGECLKTYVNSHLHFAYSLPISNVFFTKVCEKVVHSKNVGLLHFVWQLSCFQVTSKYNECLLDLCHFCPMQKFRHWFCIWQWYRLNGETLRKKKLCVAIMFIEPCAGWTRIETNTTKGAK